MCLCIGAGEAPIMLVYQRVDALHKLKRKLEYPSIHPSMHPSIHSSTPFGLALYGSPGNCVIGHIYINSHMALNTITVLSLKLISSP